MDNQEIFNQIRELQKQRTLLSTQDTALVNKINELRDKIALKNIKKGYYTDNNGLYCKVYDIEEDVIFVYEVNTSELYATIEGYPYYRAFSNAYCRECTREEYDKALDYIVKHFKSQAYDTKGLWKEKQVKYLLIMVKFIRQ